MSHHMRSDSNLSHQSQQSSIRSSRGLLSAAGAPRPDRHEPARLQRRFLGVGMLNAAQQRAKDAEEMRARIEAERTCLARTAGLAHSGEKTWASEADSLREKINEFESKVRRLRGQLANMGFDENGVDIRPSEQGSVDGTVDSTAGGSIRQSASGDDLGEELKTSPIESMESGSSVDELPEPVDGCDDIVADLSRLLTFSSDTRDIRAEVDRALPSEKHVVRVQGRDGFSPAKPEDIVDLVRAATDELEQATNRMGEIQEARRKAQGAESPIDSIEGLTSGDDADNATREKALGTLVHSALAKHKDVVETSRHLQVEATKLTEQSQKSIRSLPRAESDDSIQIKHPVATISKPTWVTEATADASKNSLTYSKGLTDSSALPTATASDVDTAKDITLLARAMQKNSPRKGSRSTSSSRSSSRRKGEKSKSYEPHHVRSRSTASSRRDSFDSSYNSPGSSVGSKTSRSVRFAALPPSYSARRTVAPHSYASRQRLTRCTTEIYPKPAQASIAQNDEDESCSSVAEKCDLNVLSSGFEKIVDPARVARKVSNGNVFLSKTMTHRRIHSADEKIDVPRAATISGAMRPRLQRTQTPRRLVRQKEALQRAVSRPPSHTSRTLNISSKAAPSPVAKPSEKEEVGTDAVQLEDLVCPQDAIPELSAEKSVTRSDLEQIPCRMATMDAVKEEQIVRAVRLEEPARATHGGVDDACVTITDVEQVPDITGRTNIVNEEIVVPAVAVEETAIFARDGALGSNDSFGTNNDVGPVSDYTEESGLVKPEVVTSVSSDGEQVPVAEEPMVVMVQETGASEAESSGSSSDAEQVETWVSNDMKTIVTNGETAKSSTSSDGEQASDGMETTGAKTEMEKLESEDTVSFTTETSLDPHMDTLPKRLFATPEPSSASSSNRRGISDGLMRRGSTLKNVPAASKKKSSRIGIFGKDRGKPTVLSSAKGSSILMSSTDDDVFSQAPSDMVGTAAKPPLGARAGAGAGFFAGETAQWQQNVRSRSAVPGLVPKGSEPLTSADSSISSVSAREASVGSGSPKKGNSRGTSSSKRSRLQSLKARLAAALK